MVIYASLMKAVTTMDMRRIVSFASKYPGRWSEPY
jgi:hypothetical protein